MSNFKLRIDNAISLTCVGPMHARQDEINIYLSIILIPEKKYKEKALIRVMFCVEMYNGCYQ